MIETKHLTQYLNSQVIDNNVGVKIRVDTEYNNEIVAIIENQPTITEKNIKEWAYEAQYRVETYKDWGYVADVMKEMLNEIGVAIIKSGK